MQTDNTKKRVVVKAKNRKCNMSSRHKPIHAGQTIIYKLTHTQICA